jgi:hypothetical protein
MNVCGTIKPLIFTETSICPTMCIEELSAVKTSSGMSGESGETLIFNLETNFDEMQLLVAPESINA